MKNAPKVAGERSRPTDIHREISREEWVIRLSLLDAWLRNHPHIDIAPLAMVTSLFAQAKDIYEQMHHESVSK